VSPSVTSSLSDQLSGQLSGQPPASGFRLGVYVFKDAEVIDYAAPYGVFSIARRFDPSLDVFLVADALRPVQTQAGLTVQPNYSLNDQPAMDALLIPGGFGTRQETYNRRLHEYVRALPDSTLLTSVCTGSWIYGHMGLLDGLPATSRKEGDNAERANGGMLPIERLAVLAPGAKISSARVVDAGRMITAGGIAAGMELGFHLLRRAGYSDHFISEVARVMEYHQAYENYRTDIEIVGAADPGYLPSSAQSHQQLMTNCLPPPLKPSLAPLVPAPELFWANSSPFHIRRNP